MPHHTRYTFPTSNGDADYSRLICRDCSTRTTGVQIPADEQAEHDAWHDAHDAHVAAHPTRYAVVRDQADRLAQIQRYLPSTYTAYAEGDDVVIHGFDNLGWGLDTYVIPRLASGLIFAREVDAQGQDI